MICEREMGTAYHLDQAMVHPRNLGKCTKMHAHLGPGVDGCQLFDGENPNDMLCGACGCHMSFHVKPHLGSRYGVEKYEVIDLDDQRGLKRCKMSLEASPAESVGDNLDAPGLEVTSGTSQDELARVFQANKIEEPVTVLPTYIKPNGLRGSNIKPGNDTIMFTGSPLYTRLCTKLNLIQQEFPEDIHGKFSIVHDDEHGFRVYCGGCDKRYGITKPGFSLGNFERGHLASKRHKDFGAARTKVQKMKDFLHQAELAKESAKPMTYCG